MLCGEGDHVAGRIRVAGAVRTVSTGSPGAATAVVNFNGTLLESEGAISGVEHPSTGVYLFTVSGGALLGRGRVASIGRGTSFFGREAVRRSPGSPVRTLLSTRIASRRRRRGSCRRAPPSRCGRRCRRR